MSYPYNISQRGPKDVNGIGNYNLLVKNSTGDKTIFNIYMLDSVPMHYITWVDTPG